MVITTLAKGVKCEKLPIEPLAPKPGPTLPIDVREAAKDSSKSGPVKDISRTPTMNIRVNATIYSIAERMTEGSMVWSPTLTGMTALG